jgi:hypothetical protein
MRHVSLIVAGLKAGRAEHGQDSTRQIHILTTRTDLAPSRLTDLGGVSQRWHSGSRTAALEGVLFVLRQSAPDPGVPVLA